MISMKFVFSDLILAVSPLLANFTFTAFGRSNHDAYLVGCLPSGYLYAQASWNYAAHTHICNDPFHMNEIHKRKISFQIVNVDSTAISLINIM